MKLQLMKLAQQKAVDDKKRKEEEAIKKAEAERIAAEKAAKDAETARLKKEQEEAIAFAKEQARLREIERKKAIEAAKKLA